MESDGNLLDSDGLLRRAIHFLSHRDFSSCRKFALMAREQDPNLTGLNQILAISEVLISVERRLSSSGLAYYPILQVRKSQVNNRILIRTQFKKFAKMLNPKTNNFPFAQEAFNHVCDAWSVLSDPEKKRKYDIEIVSGNEVQGKDKKGGNDGTGKFEEFRFPMNNVKQERSELEPEKGDSGNGSGKATFWTVCPYCFYLFEYEKVYEECCLLCQNCRRGFHGSAVAAPPSSMVDGGNGYYSGCGVFPLGFYFEDNLGQKKADGSGSENGKRDDFVVISDDEMETDVKGGGASAGDEEGQKQPEMRRVKSMAKNTKKRMGRGVKKVQIEEMMVPESKIMVEEGSNGGCDDDDDDLEFFEGDGDIFVGIKGDN